MRAIIKITVAAAALGGALAMTITSSEAQAPNAMVRQYGYQFCAMIVTFDGLRRDCMYSTSQQCQASASPNGYCVENAAYTAARANLRVSPVGQPRR